MIIEDVMKDKIYNKKDSTRIALLEQSISFIQSSLQRIENQLNIINDNIYKNNEKINNKIEKLESKIEIKIKWLFSNISMIFFSSAGIVLTAYEIWRKF
jgi:archaellum component FlaC